MTAHDPVMGVIHNDSSADRSDRSLLTRMMLIALPIVLLAILIPFGVPA